MDFLNPSPQKHRARRVGSRWESLLPRRHSLAVWQWPGTTGKLSRGFARPKARCSIPSSVWRKTIRTHRTDAPQRRLQRFAASRRRAVWTPPLGLHFADVCAKWTELDGLKRGRVLRAGGLE